MAPTKQAPVVLTRAPRPPTRRTTRTRRPCASCGCSRGGWCPSWAKDIKVGHADDQRPGRVGAGEAGVRQGRGVPALPGAGRRAGTSGRSRPTATDAKGKPRKQPFFMHRADGDVVAFAGLYEFWRDRAIADDDDPRRG